MHRKGRGRGGRGNKKTMLASPFKEQLIRKGMGKKR